MNLPEPPGPDVATSPPPLFRQEKPALAKTSHAARNGMIATVATFLGLTLLLGMSKSTESPRTTDTPIKDSGGIDSGLETQDAFGDVSVGACNTDFGLLKCEVTIVNSSGGRSDYDIEATIKDPSGAKVGTASAIVTGVEAGQESKNELIGTFKGSAKKLRLRLNEVQRIAS